MKKLLLALFVSIPFMTQAQNIWGKEIWDVYMNSCVESAKDGFSERDAYNYCACTASKLEKRYPDATKLSGLEQEEMTELATLCLNETGILNSDDNSGSSNSSTGNKTTPTPPGKASSAANAANNSNNKYYGATKWSKTGYDAFMGTCVDSAKESLGEAAATEYCDCSANKLQKMYPDESKVGNVTEEEITKIATECLSN